MTEKNYKYMRIQGRNLVANTMTGKGVFSICMEMMKWMKPALWLLDRYNQPYYLVYTNTPGNIVYEDKYQVVVKVDDIVVEEVPKSWSILK